LSLTLAQVKTEIRVLLNEATAGFFTDAEIENWIKQATIDVTSNSHCYEGTVPLTLIAGTVEITKPAGCLAVETIMHDGRGLVKIHPRQLGHIDATGRPKYWYYFAGRIGIFPAPDAVAAAKSTNAYIAMETDDVTLIASVYQLDVITLATQKGKLKDQKYSQAAALLQMYQNSVLFHRQDLQVQRVDAKEILKVPEK
jgi:hypothetical protein